MTNNESCPFCGGKVYAGRQLCELCRDKTIVVDEAHTLNGITDVRTERFAKYLKEKPEVKLDLYPFHYVHDEAPISGPLIRANFPVVHNASWQPPVSRNWQQIAEKNWRDTFNANRSKPKMNRVKNRRMRFRDRLEGDVLAAVQIPDGPWHVLENKRHPEYEAIRIARLAAYDAAAREAKAIVRRKYLAWPTYPDGTPKKLAYMPPERGNNTLHAYWYKFECMPVDQ